MPAFLLLHENFADVTQVPFVAPDIAPSVLGATPPPLDVVVSETSVSLHRGLPARPAARRGRPSSWAARSMRPYGTEQ